VAWTSSAYPPDFAFHPDVIEAGSESATPQIVCENTRAGMDYSQGKPGTQGKIAKKAQKMHFSYKGCGNPR